MDDKKRKFAFWMRPSMVAEMERMLEAADVRSKSEFVCTAVQFYLGYLSSGRSADFLAPQLADVLRNEVRSFEKHLSEMLFKLAVEQAVASNVVAAEFDVDEDNLAQLRESVARTVAKTNGIFSFETAVRLQKG